MQKSRTLLERLRLGFILFPFAIFAMQRVGAPLGWQLAVAGGAAALNLNYQRKGVLAVQAGLIVVLALLLFELKADNLPRIYPFLMSATALMAFITSWRNDGGILASYAERFVSLTAQRRAFLKSMVPLWTVGLCLNTAVFLALVFFFPLKYWVWYSGCVSYLLLAALFGWTVLRRLALTEV